MRIEGLRELDEALKELGSKVGGRILRGGVMTAAKIIEARARQYAEHISRSGALALSIGKRVSKSTLEARPGSRFTAEVGPILKNKTAIALHNLSYRRNVRSIHYGHLIERGFRRAGQLVPARPFLLPALQASQSAAVEAFKAYVGKAVRRAVEKRARRGRR